MPIFERFDVVAVPFPLSDRAASKRRPALVVSTDRFNRDHRHLVLAMITTSVVPAWPSDNEIGDLAAAGLARTSVVRLKLFTLDRDLVVRRTGTLAARDRAAVRRALKVALD